MNGPCFWPKRLATMCGKEGLERAKIRSVSHFYHFSVALVWVKGSLSSGG
jgi:hypothetical protein